MSQRLRVAQLAGAALLSAGVMVAAPATTSAASTGTTATAAFRHQAAGAGLTNAQMNVLQRQVDAYLASEGGNQIAANEVAFGHGSSTLFVIPGETYARELAQSPSEAAATAMAGAPSSCPKGDFCAYTGVNYTGKLQKMGPCDYYKLQGSGWNGPGSWYNNQSDGIQAEMYDKYGYWVYTTPPAPSHDTHGNWAKIWYIQNC
ncbi:peptidase inhibitor family I36 protein [Streptomyces sp. NPDC020801]|uniref:peptidase inhibitor family I36 protein n=1 Tax=unclassified Streptomyces TaxID=2593676 RepID=UPI00379E5035